MKIVSREQMLKYLETCDGNGIMTMEELHKIENILGFELTPSQIAYIITGEMRYTGLSTAHAIRRYLMSGDKMNFRSNNIREYHENMYQLGVIRKLVQGGMPEKKIVK